MLVESICGWLFWHWDNDVAVEYSKSVQTHFISTYVCGITIRPKLLKASRDFEYLKLRCLKCFHFWRLLPEEKLKILLKNWKILYGVGTLIRDALSGIASHGQIACYIEILTTFQSLVIHFSQGTSRNPSLIINISLSQKGTPAVKDNSKLSAHFLQPKGSALRVQSLKAPHLLRCYQFGRQVPYFET